MKSLREQMKEDTKQILQEKNEFGSLHKIDGKEMHIILDQYELSERMQRVSDKSEGAYRRNLLFRVSKEEFGAMPIVDRRMIFDSRPYRIVDAITEGEMYLIQIEVNAT